MKVVGSQTHPSCPSFIPEISVLEIFFPTQPMDPVNRQDISTIGGSGDG